jgi:hypothetical protein
VSNCIGSQLIILRLSSMIGDSPSSISVSRVFVASRLPTYCLTCFMPNKSPLSPQISIGEMSGDSKGCAWSQLFPVGQGHQFVEDCL